MKLNTEFTKWEGGLDGLSLRFSLVQEEIGLVIAKSGWQSTEKQVTEPVLVVSFGALHSLDISTLGHHQAHTQRFLAISSFSLEINLCYDDEFIQNTVETGHNTCRGLLRSMMGLVSARSKEGV